MSVSGTVPAYQSPLTKPPQVSSCYDRSRCMSLITPSPYTTPPLPPSNSNITHPTNPVNSYGWFLQSPLFALFSPSALFAVLGRFAHPLTNPATSVIIIARLFYQAIPRVNPSRGAEERTPRPIPRHIETGEESGWDRRREWLFPIFFYSTTPAAAERSLFLFKAPYGLGEEGQKIAGHHPCLSHLLADHLTGQAMEEDPSDGRLVGREPLG